MAYSTSRCCLFVTYSRDKLSASGEAGPTWRPAGGRQYLSRVEPRVRRSRPRTLRTRRSLPQHKDISLQLNAAPRLLTLGLALCDLVTYSSLAPNILVLLVHLYQIHSNY